MSGRSYPLTKSKLLTGILVSSLCVSASGCSTLGLDNISTDKLDVSTTTAATATGTLFGAGLGAIIGSETGSAGGGLAIGSAAGAAAGYLVGRQLERGEEQRNVQNEKLRRQKEMLDTQQRELEDLRRQNDSSPLAMKTRESLERQQLAMNGSRPRLGAGFGSNAKSSSRFRVRPYTEVMAEESGWKPSPPKPSNVRPVPIAKRRAAKPFEEDLIAEPIKKPKPAPKLAARTPEPKRVSVPLPPEPVRVTPPVPAPKPSLRAGLAGEDLPLAAKKEEKKAPVKEAAKESDNIAEKSLLTSPDSTARAVEEDVPAETATAPAVPKETALPPAVRAGAEAPSPAESAPVAKKSPGAAADACAKAEEEAKRAKSAVSEADQLFYLRRALRLCPDGARYHLEIGNIYATLGRAADAEFEFRQALEIEPGNAQAKDGLSRLSQQPETN